MYDVTPVNEFAIYYLDNEYYDKNGQLNHAEQFEEAGYYGVKLSSSRWNEMHCWLEKHYPNRYCWTGSIFWFDDERIAADVALRWS